MGVNLETTEMSFCREGMILLCPNQRGSLRATGGSNVFILITNRRKESLGSGQFWNVNRGTWSRPEGKLDVALKYLTKDATRRDTIYFLQEAATMMQFNHPNILHLHGIVKQGTEVRQ